jgi:hypothetical protein
MVPVGAAGTNEFQKCADSWTDSEIANLRARLPVEYHGVPTDWLKTEWILIRKRGTDGYRVRGHGPSKDRYLKREGENSKEYMDWIRSAEFKSLARTVKERAGYRCQVCNSCKSPEAHHRTYDSMKTEREIDDLVCLCSRCHEWYHKKIKTMPMDLF